MSDLCEHGYIVRASVDEYRYLCKECDERFERHPFAAVTPPAVLRKREVDAETARKEEELSLTASAKALAAMLFPNDENIKKRVLGQK